MLTVSLYAGQYPALDEPISDLSPVALIYHLIVGIWLLNSSDSWARVRTRSHFPSGPRAQVRTKWPGLIFVFAPYDPHRPLLRYA